ncbi:MAG: ATP-binding cassette domain-containing protein [Coriobacteriales bacterium]|jgi:D-methionine transport system ATP-binding protein|nr:ATP-binding cassette domain-containing protein [Coriobacteriales bacterium]
MIKIRDIYKTYQGGSTAVKALRGVSLDVAKGEIYGVIGHSGSGKSTLIRCINQLERVDSGQIFVGGNNTNNDITKLPESKLRRKRSQMGMIFQHFNLLNNSNVYQNVAMPLVYYRVNKKEIAARVKNLLELVGLWEKRKAYPSELSGGQKQRVAIARALANNPDILLSDEATSALDPDTTESILALLKEVNQKLGITIVIIAHQMSVIKDICSKVAVLHEGIIVDQGQTVDVFTNPTHHVTERFANSLFQAERLQDILSSGHIRNICAAGGTVARFLFRGSSADEALISQISRDFNVDVNVIFGNIVLFGKEPIGHLYVAISGSDDNINKAVAYAQSRGVLFSRINTNATSDKKASLDAND